MLLNKSLFSMQVGEVLLAETPNSALETSQKYLQTLGGRIS
jgi:hypothetical protein